MVNRFRMTPARLFRVLVTILMVCGLTGLPADSGAISGCSADCPMHLHGTSEMECCSAMNNTHCSPSAAAGEAHRSFSPVPGSGCDDLSCVASPDDTAVVLSSGGGFPEGGSFVSFTDSFIGGAVPDSASDISLEFFQQLVSPPIYKRTCVYLI